MKVPLNQNKARPFQCSSPIICPGNIIPKERWTLVENFQGNTSRSDGHPYFSGPSFMRLCLPALFYSVIINASLRILQFLPFTSRFHIKAEHLRPEDCLLARLPSASTSIDVGNVDISPTSASVAIVTGSNTGVGYETASTLAERGFHVILACRSREKGEAAADKINQRLSSLNITSGGRALFLYPLDLSSFKSVRSFCEEFSKKYNSLNILVNNAGINGQGDVTEDGLEICFQSNFVGHFLLTKLLLSRLLKSKNSYLGEGTASNQIQEAGRVVNLSSVTHHFAPANERTIENTRSDKTMPLNNGIHDDHFWLGSAMAEVPSATYRESKLASILFSMELNKRFGDKGLRSIAVNPGAVSSDIWRNDSEMTQKLYRLIYLTTKQGASTSVAGAIGNFPKGAKYLQPYWQPDFLTRQPSSTDSDSATSFGRCYSLPFPMTEMLGPYVGYAVTEPRLPSDGKGGYQSSEDLWNVCEKLTTT